MLCGWEGNRSSGVTLAMPHRLSGLSTYGLKSHAREMNIPPTLQQEYGPLHLYLTFTTEEIHRALHHMKAGTAA